MSDSSASIVAVRRSDYRTPVVGIETVALHLELDADRTLVHATLGVIAREPLRSLTLDAEALTIDQVLVDGVPLDPAQVEYADDKLTIAVGERAAGARFEVQTRVWICPRANTALSGLYASSTMLCTQCEAEGFRRITPFLDRPDVMSSYTVTLIADPVKYPVLLSNGDCVSRETLSDGRSKVVWHDPFAKPSYLFAVVAGPLKCHAGTYTTASGRDVALEIWVEPQNLDKCEHALQSLIRSMQWDEREYGLEYDLSTYMIVAVDDFNMGAMENKGLNVFNSRFVLASPDSATDDDYDAIEGVIGHEYFHNWTGNRVTCRDWFQLTLKEGLTVYRDQRFSADMGSAAMKRILDVRQLRAVQFAEDAGPMSHPVRPETYVEINNFYTATVYEKGAEVVRMYEALLGRDGFRQGMDLYFERHDGQAVTCDDFRAAMADANAVDLAQFERWYQQPGTPTLHAQGRLDAAAGTYELTLSQRPSARAGEHAPPLMIPVRMALFDGDGARVALRLADEASDAVDAGATERVITLRDRVTTFRFEGVAGPVVPSLLRGFSAPVRLEWEAAPGERAFLARHDDDPFVQWDALQSLMTQDLLAAYAAGQLDHPLSDAVVEAARASLDAGGEHAGDDSLRALALTLPSEQLLTQQIEGCEPLKLFELRRAARRQLATTLEALWRDTWRRTTTAAPETAAHRRLANTCLDYLVWLPDGRALIDARVAGASCMTHLQPAVAALGELGGDTWTRALEAFHARHGHEPLVLNKWFMLQATAPCDEPLARLEALLAHPEFRWDNPNRLRSVVEAFAQRNPSGFHQVGGRGHRVVADAILRVDAHNPQVASRVVAVFEGYRRYAPDVRASMRAAIEHIASGERLSVDVREKVLAYLADDERA